MRLFCSLDKNVISPLLTFFIALKVSVMYDERNIPIFCEPIHTEFHTHFSIFLGKSYSEIQNYLVKMKSGISSNLRMLDSTVMLSFV